ncbi:hypothetical protein [Tahibacter harae]|jgi:hypothetical protein|uniref:Uncharacterized protein n=1 Tax=Tahibacter harae TaxID=2963937 RepID=A0ABT1QX13_9GAMM|nr:hypothetical protein [Tahibacter harae]MCQ4166825.1 hypothetical protein [Tahibacter harae]
MMKLMSGNTSHDSLLQLLDNKTLSPQQRVRVIATATALDMIVLVLTRSNDHKLADEMQNLQKYADAIEASLTGAKPA